MKKIPVFQISIENLDILETELRKNSFYYLNQSRGYKKIFSERSRDIPLGAIFDEDFDNYNNHGIVMIYNPELIKSSNSKNFNIEECKKNISKLIKIIKNLKINSILSNQIY